MPTASDYETAAVRFRRQGHWCRNVAIELTSDTDRWLVGPVAGHHAASVSRVRHHLLAAGDVFERLATIADRRSAVCADHAAAVRRYEQLDPWVRLLTPRPQPPTVWAEA